MSGFGDLVTALDALASRLDEGRRDTVDAGDFRDLLSVVMKQQHAMSELQHRAENTFRWGMVEEADAEKGYQVTFGTDADGKPLPSAWFPHHEQGGERSTWRPSTKGQIVGVLSPNGDQRQAIMIPKGGFSDANPAPSKKLDENVESYGKYRREERKDDTLEKVGKSRRTATAQGKITEDTGDQPAGGGMATGFGGNLPHELNRQLQGMRATLTQHDNNIAGLHEAASKMREIAQTRIPELATLIPILNGDPGSLERAAQAALGNLEGYVAKTFQQALGKLTNGFMSNVMGLVQGFMSGQIGGLLGQIGALASAHGVEGLVQGALNDAQAMVADVAIGAAHEAFEGRLDAVGAAFAGTPGEAAFALLRGQIGGALGGALDIAGNLGGLLDGQQNLVKGLTRSYRLGGY